MNRTLSILFFLSCTLLLSAVPALDLPLTFTQSDGTQLTVRLQGDEHFSYYTTDDDFLLVREGDAFYYGMPTASGEVLSTGVLAHMANHRIAADNAHLFAASTLQPSAVVRKRQQEARQMAMASNFPTKGSPHTIVILVHFKDNNFTIKNPVDSFSLMLNQSGYNKNGAAGSAKDYFIASSDSLFSPVFDVVGPYALPKEMAYYGANRGGNNSAHADEMIISACNSAQADGVDFSKYDYNNDGLIDNVYVYYAGWDESSGGGPDAIWAHRSVVPSKPIFNGKKLYDYACSSELSMYSSTKQASIGTICHEFSHVLGLPDLYDTDYGKKTVGTWSLMASGSHSGTGYNIGITPPAYTAFERFSVGWAKPTLLTDAGRQVLEPLETSSQSYIIAPEGFVMDATKDGQEYFILENRQHVGWDAPYTSLPGTGLVVWHIRYSASAWSQNVPNSGNNLFCFVECATGDKMTNGSAADPYPGTRNVQQFNPVLANGTILNQPVLDISQFGNDISFIFKQDGTSRLAFSPAEIGVLQSTYTRSAGKDTRTMQVLTTTLVGTSIDPNDPITVTTSQSNFQVSLDSLSWGRSLSLNATADSAVNVLLYLRYRPTAQVCNVVSAMLQARQSTNLQTLPLRATAPRALLITAPKVESLDNVSPYSAEIKWKEVYDASQYSLVLYQIQDGQSEYTQGFEDFDSPTQVAKDGWYSNFNRLSSTAGEGSRSMWFKESTDTLVSATYPQPITHLSFWYNVPTTSSDSVGILYVDAWDGKEMRLVKTIFLTKRDRKKTASLDFSVEENYTSFRFTFDAGDGEGVAIDDYHAICSKKIEYVYATDEFIIPATEEKYNTCYLNGLTPNTEYFYYLSSSDAGRGACEEHVLQMDTVLSFTTLPGKNGERDLSYGEDSIHYARSERVIYVPEALGDRALYFYDIYGHLIAKCAVGYQENRVKMPEGNFIPGNIYIVKYAVVDKLKRKDRFVKILY